MSFIKTTAVAAAMCLSAGGASAALVTVHLDSVTPALNDNSSVNISATPSGSTGKKFAVAQNYTETAPGGVLGAFAAFCLDLAASVSPSGTYTYNTINEPFSPGDPFTNSYGFTSTQQDRIQAMFDANYAAASADWNSNASAFQFALWEAGFEAEGNTLDLQTGVFTGTDFTAGDTDISNKAKDYLDSALAYIMNGGAQKYALTYLESAPSMGENTSRSQNLVTATVIPLPAAGFLLFGALGALGVASRRRKAASEA